MNFRELYESKKLERFYRKEIIERKLTLTREECDKKYGVGELFHLNVHSKFSILDGVDSPDALFQEAKNNNMQGLAMTETGFMSSIPDCYISSKSTGLKYIAGISAYFCDFETARRSIIDNENDDIKNHPFVLDYSKVFRTPTITILAKNQEGYKELLNINDESWRNGFYYVPKVTREILKKYTNGNLVILSGNLIDRFIEFGFISDIEFKEYRALSAYDYLEWFNENFGNDFYVELVMRCQDNYWGSDLDRLMTTSAILNKFEEKHGFKLNTVMTNDVKYIDRKYETLYRAMKAIGRNTTLNRVKDSSSELYFKTRSELRGTFDQCKYDRAFDINTLEKSCDLTLDVADKCDSFIADVSPKLPSIPNAKEILIKKTLKALKEKGLDKDKTKYEVDGVLVTPYEQVKIELERFIEKGFESYFLIMQDLIQHSKDLGYDIGPSRGSSGGSLVCYLLGIVSINPLLYKLSFSRFLSPSRGGYMLKVSMD
jgi:DNA polymerase-3 subunit alpha